MFLWALFLITLTASYVSLQSFFDSGNRLFSRGGIQWEKQVRDSAKIQRSKGISVLVTGAADFVGTHVSVALKKCGLVSLLEASKSANPQPAVIWASSSSVYGLNEKVPFSESNRTDQPTSLYAATKKVREEIAHTYNHIYGLSITGLRFFMVVRCLERGKVEDAAPEAEDCKPPVVIAEMEEEVVPQKIDSECLDPFDELECEDYQVQAVCVGHGEDYQVQAAVGQCPRSCIHYVTPSQRIILEELLDRLWTRFGLRA